MSIADLPVGNSGDCPVEHEEATRPLHRLGAVRRLQGVSRRAVARRLNVDVSVVREQERETADLSLSTLYQWQQLLEVPVGELLIEANDPLSPPVLTRAKMLRLMKTALAILERTSQVAIRRMAQTMVDQLVDMMPELKGVSAWHAVGQRRRLDELGRAAERRLSHDVFMDFPD